MSGKTTPSGGRSASGRQGAGGQPKSKSTGSGKQPGASKAKAGKVPEVAAESSGGTKPAKSGKRAGTRATRPAAKSAGKAGPTGEILTKEGLADQLLSRAEADIAAAIEALNNQMNAALAKLTELASTQCGRGQVVVRTAPLDRATATFQRLVAEVVEDQQAEMLPPLIALRNELAQRAGGDGDGDGDANPVQGDDFHQRGLETLDHVLQLAGVQSFTPRIGEPFDPLIHLAVGEARREDLEQGSVAETLQPGFRSTRGKVLAAARILVNRR